MSINAIYIIKCKLCPNTYYIGETKCIKNRISQHINDIKNFIMYKKYTCVSLHFNLKNHNYKEHFSFFVFERSLEDRELRELKEKSLIFLFKKLNMNVLNDYIPSINALL